jgi:excisionase family DNA binding protein
MQKELLTPDEAAALLKVNPNTIRTWLRQGKLKGVKLAGGVWRISDEAIKAFIGEEQAEG